MSLLDSIKDFFALPPGGCKDCRATGQVNIPITNHYAVPPPPVTCQRCEGTGKDPDAPDHDPPPHEYVRFHDWPPGCIVCAKPRLDPAHPAEQPFVEEALHD